MKLDIPFPLISDPTRRLYKAFGLKQVSALGLVSPSVAFKGFLAMTKGYAPGIPTGDVRQLPGVFIIKFFNNGDKLWQLVGPAMRECRNR